MPDDFQLGDHVFTGESSGNPFDRPAPKRILGAPPPTLFDGITRDSADDSPAAEFILDGSFCGHGEPTFAVFDLVIDGEDVLECLFFTDEDDEDPDADADAGYIAVRKSGTNQWRTIWASEWAERQETLEGCEPPEFDDEGRAALDDAEPWRGRVSIGFEYPSDCDSRNCVTWMTLYFRSEDGTEGGCMVDAELA